MKPGIASLVVAAAFAASAAMGEAGAQGAEGQWVAGAFKSLCFDPFGDEKAVQSAVASYPDLQFRKVEARADVPSTGTAWEADKATLLYSSAEWLPRDLPSPQCTLTAEAGAGFDHAATAAAIEAAIPVGPGKTKGKPGRRQSTEWNFAGPGGAKRRLFLSTERRGGDVQVRVSLLNLRK